MLRRILNRYAGNLSGKPDDAKPRPNVLWICADDFWPGICGAYGNSLVKTPAIDRLAREGIRFDRAYCTCPLSTPSRQSFWTGRYPRSIGVTLSPTPLPEDEVTLPTMLRRAGYETAALGKTHYYLPRRHEFDVCIDWPEYQTRLDFQRWQPVMDKGDVLGTWRPFEDPASEWLNSRCLPCAARDADMFGTFLASCAGEYLSSEKARPFFLYVSFYETHSPFWFPIEFRDRHNAAEFAVPQVTPEDWQRLPQVFHQLSPAEKGGIAAAYATSAEFLDKNVGIILDALARSPHAANTMVLFTSDHGYLLGQHGRFEKHCCYEPAVRTALLMRQPGGRDSGRVISAMVSLIDLVPTILDACHIAQPGNLQGRTLTPLLEHRANSHRESVIVEYSDNEEAMIRTESWKLIYSTGARQRRDGYALHAPAERGPSLQLFDVRDDPDELTNLADVPAFAPTIKNLLQQLADHLVRTARDGTTVPADRDVPSILSRCLSPRDMSYREFLRRQAQISTRGGGATQNETPPEPA